LVFNSKLFFFSKIQVVPFALGNIFEFKSNSITSCVKEQRFTIQNILEKLPKFLFNPKENTNSKVPYLRNIEKSILHKINLRKNWKCSSFSIKFNYCTHIFVERTSANRYVTKRNNNMGVSLNKNKKISPMKG